MSRERKIAVELTCSQWRAVCEAIGFATSGDMADIARQESVAEDRKVWRDMHVSHKVINEALDKSGARKRQQQQGEEGQGEEG